MLVSVTVPTIALLCFAAASGGTETASTSTTVAGPEQSVEEVFKSRPEDARAIAEEQKVDLDDVLLFVPRAVLLPVRLTLSFLFLPLKELVHLVQNLVRSDNIVGAQDKEKATVAILPVVSVLSTDGLTAGALAYYEDLFGHRELGSLRANFLGLYTQAYGAKLVAPNLGGSKLWLESEVGYESRPKLRYYLPEETRYREDHAFGRLRSGLTYGTEGGRIQLGASVTYDFRRFKRAKHAGDHPVLEDLYDTSTLPGYDDGTQLLETAAELVVDFRDRPVRTSSGYYLEAFAGGVPRQEEYSFFHWGGEVVGYIDLYKQTRVLALRAAVDAVDAVDGKDASIPFANLPSLGGPHGLREYALDRFRDQKAAFASIEYHYPIHQIVAGKLFVDAGRVAKNYRDFFDGDENDWKLGFGGGIVVTGERSTILDLQLSYGEDLIFFVTTDPFVAFEGRASRR